MNQTAPISNLPSGRLEWRLLLQWLHDDGLVGDDEAARVRAALRRRRLAASIRWCAWRSASLVRRRATAAPSTPRP